MPEYFTQFPEVINDGESITNVCLRVDFFNAIKNAAILFEDLKIRDGDFSHTMIQTSIGSYSGQIT